ncbi:general secretion pathway protein L [Pseudoxanthomonas sp. GM95]|uniref:PilN domain-containing protein n=1 Tax=Pseudoxanthomonas sp. GM95 TaxID=1881043 RepID=UPI0008D7288B|nr:PilN domain-containing protein [Pseudoxanthomonas sp. GM95]SEK45555.1 general secretion pathway protein L [Pseudoxanthomonas sp. GM95]
MTTPRAGTSVLPGLGRSMGAASRFFSWWRDALSSWLPARWRTLFGLAAERLLLVPQAAEAALVKSGPAGLETLASLPLPVSSAELDAVLDSRLAGLPRWSLLPAVQVLRRPLLLPAAAAERLREVVGFEIDRQTPFTADAVYFDARITGRRADGQIEAELVVVRRQGVDRALEALGPVAQGLAGLDVADASGQPLGVNLLPPALRVRRASPARSWNLIAALVAVLALAFAGWQVLANREAAADAFAAQVERSAAQARGVAAQRQQLVDLVEGAKFLQAQRAARPTTVEVLDELTRLLPDNTYLEKVSIEGDRLLLIGLSPEAPGLVKVLEGSKLWTSPALTGALQMDRRTRLDRFSMTAQLAGPKPPSNTAPKTGRTPNGR